LGEFSHIGRLFTFCRFLEITEAARICKLPFSRDEVMYLPINFDKEWFWATIWAIEKTHLVTLPEINFIAAL
jgi:hypothetical protein